MFLTVEFARAAGITYRQADYWIRQGILRPIGEGRPGSGARREWDEHEIRVARVVAAVIVPSGGRVVSNWPKLAETLRARLAELWIGLVFVDPERATVSDHAEHGSVVIDLGLIDRDTRREVARIYRDRARYEQPQYVGAF